jgi:transposase
MVQHFRNDLGVDVPAEEQRDAGREQGGWELEIVERDKEAKGFEVLPKRWIVERTFG